MIGINIETITLLHDLDVMFLLKNSVYPINNLLVLHLIHFSEPTP
jgi:hypothetical protein